jgi:hypothetical protein
MEDNGNVQVSVMTKETWKENYMLLWNTDSHKKEISNADDQRVVKMWNN